MSNDLTKKTQIINRNRKQHISFKEDFVCIIDVDSWKEFNIDISESKTYFKKIKPILNKNVISINTNIDESKMAFKCNVF
jgi:hypothetical protein